jgi:hypothetical protein
MFDAYEGASLAGFQPQSSIRRHFIRRHFIAAMAW